MSTILLIILILLLVGALPAWPYSSGWGYWPSGGLGLILLILIILALTGTSETGAVLRGEDAFRGWRATKPESLSDPIMQRLSAFCSLSTIGSDIAGASRTRVAQIDKGSAKIHIVACEAET